MSNLIIILILLFIIVILSCLVIFLNIRRITYKNERDELKRQERKLRDKYSITSYHLRNYVEKKVNSHNTLNRIIDFYKEEE